MPDFGTIADLYPPTLVGAKYFLRFCKILNRCRLRSAATTKSASKRPQLFYLEIDVQSFERGAFVEAELRQMIVVEVQGLNFQATRVG
jgi:hypothetical protein